VSYFSGFKDGVDELTPWLGKNIIDKMKISVDPKQRISSIISNIACLLDENNLHQNTSGLRRIAVENYDWKKRADQMVKSYSNITSRHLKTV